MFKAVILLTRAEGMSRQEFRSWWLEQHAPLARQLPGVRRLVFNVVDNEDASCDGVSELWFDSREAFDAGYASELGRRVAADSLAHVSARVRLFECYESCRIVEQALDQMPADEPAGASAGSAPDRLLTAWRRARPGRRRRSGAGSPSRAARSAPRARSCGHARPNLQFRQPG